MTVKDNSAPAYKLLGQIMEVQNQMQQAIDAYKRCLDLDPQHNDVLLKGQYCGFVELEDSLFLVGSLMLKLDIHMII